MEEIWEQDQEMIEKFKSLFSRGLQLSKDLDIKIGNRYLIFIYQIESVKERGYLVGIYTIL